MHDLPVVDLFSSVGGFSLGAARAGFRIHGSVELDDHAHAAHAKNFPNTLHWQKDISEITASSFFKHFNLSRGELFGLIGGPPCQGFSAIGKNDLKDPRRLLFSKFFALVNDIRPKFFLAENVPGILDEKHVGVINSALQMVPDEYIVLPYKAFFVSMLTRDISLTDAILDLLDNCVDGILRSKPRLKKERPYLGFYAHITFDKDTFAIHDNCGGIDVTSFFRST